MVLLNSVIMMVFVIHGWQCSKSELEPSCAMCSRLERGKNNMMLVVDFELLFKACFKLRISGCVPNQKLEISGHDVPIKHACEF